MKFSIGYQHNERLKRLVLEHREQVRELYFPWGTFPTGRGEVRDRASQEALEHDLAEYASAGIGLDLLLNGNCFGRHALARTFYQRIGDTVELLCERYALRAVTTASPSIARFLRRNFPDLTIRASVNMEIGTPEGADYLLEWFDSFYMKRELNYDFPALRAMYDFCRRNRKELLILANSGCLNYCSARTFHDNLVSHQEEIAEMDNAFVFHGICTEYLSCAAKREDLLRLSNFIRPEDVPLYENLCDSIKLATRTNFNPAAVVSAYFSGHFSGNLLELTEPAHSELFHPAILAGDRMPADYGKRRLNCAKDCAHCGFCREVQKNATVTLS
ncbi:MAG: hypothetical protein GX902_04525 [Lentisphaerae bacterium]|mgnify:CR=1 FL=1|nr:hypothetical protein [Lentisphaerota bacterium]